MKDLSLHQLEQNHSLYGEKLRELLRLSKFPGDFSSEVELVETVELPHLVREKLKIEVEPNLWIPLYLFLPKSVEGPQPCILVVHGHSSGKIETAGLVSSYQQGNALRLAEAGFVTVAPDLRGFGELGWAGEWEDPLGHDFGRSIHIQHVMANLRTGRTALGTYLHDLQRILDYLVRRPEVDPERVGVTGTSMGGDIAIWLAILDPRIKAIAANAPGLLHYPKKHVEYGSFHVCIHTIPGIRNNFLFRELPLLVAPRPFFLDIYQRVPERPFVQETLERLYRESGHPEKLLVRSYPGQETFHNQPVIEWFKKWLS